MSFELKYSLPPFGESSLEDLKKTYTKAFEVREQIINYGWEIFNRVCLSLESGIVIFSAPPNIGKSAFMLNLYHQIIENNKDVKVVDFSLDDPIDKRHRSGLAMMSGLTIDEVTFASTLSEVDQLLLSNTTKEYAKRLSRIEVFDASSLSNSARSVNSIVEYCRYFRDKVDSVNKLIVVVDGFHNLRVQNDKYADNQNARQEEISAVLSTAATQYDCIMLASAQTNKGSRHRGRDSDSVRGSGSIAYDAQVITSLFNDVKVNDTEAEVYMIDDVTGNMIQVLEVDVTKSKASGFDGIIFYSFDHNRFQVKELPLGIQSQFKDCVYSKSIKEKR